MITIHREDTEYGVITIFRSRDTGSCIYSQGGSYQSEADSRGVSLASYVHAMHGFVVQSAAKTVVVIGCAGGTLATMLAYSGMTVSVVDVNRSSVDLARRYFALPADVIFHLGDGNAFLNKTDAAFDAIAVDAYVGNEIPGHLRSQAFLETARRRLTPHGVVLFNVHVAHDFDPGADAVGATMMLAGLPVRILDAPCILNRNTIVLGGAVAGLDEPRLMMPPAFSAGQIVKELDRMSFRPCRQSQAESE